jgi:hypothetical protein
MLASYGARTQDCAYTGPTSRQAGRQAVVAIAVVLFGFALLSLVVGALLYLSEERSRRDPTDMRYRHGHRR